MNELTREQRRTVDFLATAGPYASTTVDSKDLRAIMLATGASLMARGRLWNIKARHLGAGVHKLTVELANP